MSPGKSDGAPSERGSTEPASTRSADRPLAGVRVLDIATFLAAPFAGTVLADFGAEVIKVEQPGTGDPLRRFGTPTEAGDTLVWLSEARNKKSMTLDLRTPEGAEISPASRAPSPTSSWRISARERWRDGGWATRRCARSIRGW